jgi:hypothetical protein
MSEKAVLLIFEYDVKIVDGFIPFILQRRYNILLTSTEDLFMP